MCSQDFGLLVNSIVSYLFDPTQNYVILTGFLLLTLTVWNI